MPYERQALRTVSPGFHQDLIPASEVYHRLRAFIDAASALDYVKKTLFYGKPYALKPTDAQPSLFGRKEIPAELVDILHAAIGMATESGELLEAVALALFDMQELDLVNVQEELGDMFWYLALAASRSGKTFTELQSQNLAKLQARFPERFTQDAALTRDLQREREVLEVA